MGDERPNDHSGEVMGREEAADHRRGGRPPDGKPEIERIVGFDVRNLRRERRPDVGVALACGLGDGRLVVLGVGVGRQDFEEIGRQLAMEWPAMTRVFPEREK